MRRKERNDKRLGKKVRADQERLCMLTKALVLGLMWMMERH